MHVLHSYILDTKHFLTRVLLIISLNSRTIILARNFIALTPLRHKGGGGLTQKVTDIWLGEVTNQITPKWLIQKSHFVYTRGNGLFSDFFY